MVIFWNIQTLFSTVNTPIRLKLADPFFFFASQIYWAAKKESRIRCLNFDWTLTWRGNCFSFCSPNSHQSYRSIWRECDVKSYDFQATDYTRWIERVYLQYYSTLRYRSKGRRRCPKLSKHRLLIKITEPIELSQKYSIVVWALVQVRIWSSSSHLRMYQVLWLSRTNNRWQSVLRRGMCERSPYA